MGGAGLRQRALPAEREASVAQALSAAARASGTLTDADSSRLMAHAEALSIEAHA